jgi:hypothetical protein
MSSGTPYRHVTYPYFIDVSAAVWNMASYQTSAAAKCMPLGKFQTVPCPPETSNIRAAIDEAGMHFRCYSMNEKERDGCSEEMIAILLSVRLW